MSQLLTWNSRGQEQWAKCQTLCEVLNQLFTLKQFKKMKKKGYQKPTMKVVILQHRTQLLAGSGLNDPNDYTPGGNPFTY